jgi:hypothetical protein
MVWEGVAARRLEADRLICIRCCWNPGDSGFAASDLCVSEQKEIPALLQGAPARMVLLLLERQPSPILYRALGCDMVVDEMSATELCAFADRAIPPLVDREPYGGMDDLM